MGLIRLFDFEFDLRGVKRSAGTVATDMELGFEKRDSTPKIGGSFGGFIALVVCLTLIIIVTCTATFFLLRDHEPTDAERTARRRNYRHHRDSSTSGSASMFERIKALFSRASRSIKTGSKASRGGWVQADSGDEWEDDSVDGDVRRSHSSGRSGPGGQQEMSYSPRPDPPFRPPPIATTDSTSTVRFEVISASRQTEPFQSLYTSYPAIHSARTRDSSLPSSFSSSWSPPPVERLPTLPQTDIPRSMSPESMESTMRASRTSSEPVSGLNAGRREDSATRTFFGGTKFIESL